MSHILFFDTETTGLPKRWGMKVEDTWNWPRIVELGIVVTDLEGNTLYCMQFIIKPSGFTIPKEASDIHGITQEIADEQGTSILDALSKFEEIAKDAKMIVAHNIDFDKMVIGAEFIRAKSNFRIDEQNLFCTMKASTSWCKIPHANGKGVKWPKLQELHVKLFNEEFSGAHGAVADIEATARCFFELKRLKVIEVVV